ncbi:MAG: hypothetical protein GY820_09785, partial [Gammaproteobacteria bacterium]|nr:hypothetical protein [Gammaproteobacteria bacterium]
MVSAQDGSACPECGVDLKKITQKKMDAAEAEKLRKELEKCKARMEKAEKGEAQSSKDNQQLTKQVEEGNARAEHEKAETNDHITKLNRVVDNLQREKQDADAETAVKAVNSSVTTQANTTTAGPVATSHSLPTDGVQVLPSQGVPQGLNSSTPLPPKGAMRGARAQNYHGPREYVNQNFSSHRSITFQDPLVQQVHTAEGDMDMSTHSTKNPLTSRKFESAILIRQLLSLTSRPGEPFIHLNNNISLSPNF